VQTRLHAKIHTIWEIVGGAIVGILITALFFKAFA